MPALIIFSTCKSLEEAKKIAETLVKEKLAACVNVTVMPVRSFFTWKGAFEECEEHLLIIKTSSKLFNNVEKRVRDMHSYEKPEIIAVEVTYGSKDYLDWIEDSVKERDVG
jgi:periplasmic divalent cation tolerance protein